MARFVVSILGCVAAAYGLGYYLTVPANPEIRFWREVENRRESEIAAVRNQNPALPLILFTGGSSTAFSIDPAIIEQDCRRPAFNLALPAAAGTKYLLHQALTQARRGDVLVVCLERDFLAYDSSHEASPFAFGLAVTAGTPAAAAGGATFDSQLGLRDYLNLSRPGARYLATLLGKAAIGKGYRYTTQDLRYHGRIETQVTDPTMQPLGALAHTTLSATGSDLLRQFREAAIRNGVSVLYSMPWQWTSPDCAANNRTENTRLMAAIHTVIPTVDDGHYGVATERHYFSDSPQHLTAQGSAARSHALAAALARILAPG